MSEVCGGYTSSQQSLTPHDATATTDLNNSFPTSAINYCLRSAAEWLTPKSVLRMHPLGCATCQQLVLIYCPLCLHRLFCCQNSNSSKSNDDDACYATRHPNNPYVNHSLLICVDEIFMHLKYFLPDKKQRLTSSLSSQRQAAVQSPFSEVEHITQRLIFVCLLVGQLQPMAVLECLSAWVVNDTHVSTCLSGWVAFQG